MSRKGCSPDNSACEGVFGRTKKIIGIYESYGVQTKSRVGSLASPRNRPHPHPSFRNIVIVTVQFFGLRRTRRPSFRTGNNHPRHRSLTDQENDRQNPAGRLRSVNVNQPLCHRRHNKRAAGCAGLYQARNRAALVQKPFQRSRQTGRINHSRARTCQSPIKQVQLGDRRRKTGQEPSCRNGNSRL